MADPARFELTTSAFGGQWKGVFPCFPEFPQLFKALKNI
jgi:hypothetical protein